MAKQQKQSKQNKIRLFISYSRRDFGKIEKLYEALSGDDELDVYLDQHDIAAAEDWKQRLDGLIRSSDTILFAVSRDSVASDICQWEIDLATQLNKRIIPVVINDVADEDVPEEIARLNYVFARTDKELIPALQSIGDALKIDIDWIREHTRLADMAHRWEQASKLGAQPLRGKELEAAEQWLSNQPKDAPAPTELQRKYIYESRKSATKRQRMTVMGSIAAMLIVGVLAGFAFVQRNAAIEGERKAEEALRSATKTADVLLDDVARSLEGTLIPREVIEKILDQVRGLQVELGANFPNDPALKESRKGALLSLLRLYRSMSNGKNQHRSKIINEIEAELELEGDSINSRFRFEFLLQKAAYLIDVKQSVKANTIYQSMRSNVPNSVMERALLQLAKIALQDSKISKAEIYFKSLDKLEEKQNIADFLLLGCELKTLGKEFGKAFEYCNNLLKHAKSMEDYYKNKYFFGDRAAKRLAEIHYYGQYKDIDKVRSFLEISDKYLKVLISEDPSNRLAQHAFATLKAGFGYYFWSVGDANKSADSFRSAATKAESLLGDSGVDYFQIRTAANSYGIAGNMMEDFGNWKAALDFHVERIRIYDTYLPRNLHTQFDTWNYIFGHSQLAEAYRMLGDESKSINHSQLALRDLPLLVGSIYDWQKERVAILYNQALLVKIESRKKALGAIDKILLSLNQSNEYEIKLPDIRKNTLARRAYIYTEMGFEKILSKNFREAAKLLRKATNDDPSNHYASLHLAYALMYLGKNKVALSIHQHNKTRKLSNTLYWNQAVQDDFKDLRNKGLTHPMMDEIEALFKKE